MKSEEKYKIEKEIEYWSNQQELDKFNYEIIQNKLLNIMGIHIVILIGFSELIFGIAKFPLNLTGFLGLSFLIIINWTKIFNKLNSELNQHAMSYNCRDKQIEELYLKLGIDKKGLNIKHEEIKKNLELEILRKKYKNKIYN
jgi:hypothetical protein